jgi:hypothetical protein
MFSKDREHPSSFTQMSINDIFSSDIPCQYKANVADGEQNMNKIQKYYSKLALKWHHKLLSGSQDAVFMIRICSKNWIFDAHFDCVDNTVVILEGSKRFLLFELFNHKYEKQICQQMKGLTIDDSIYILDRYKIKWKHVKLNKNQSLFVRNGLYHKVQSDEPSVLLNIDVPLGGMEMCVEKFNEMYPIQKILCMNNDCID